jgi:hypothetical protein
MPAYLSKPLPRAALKLEKRRLSRKDDRAIKAEIRAYHGHRCKVCRKRGNLEVHEEKRRGAGGLVSLVNSYPVCVLPTGACHDLLQSRHIEAEMADGSETFDARKPLRFVMGQRVADIVFPSGRIPEHVTVIPEGR